MTTLKDYNVFCSSLPRATHVVQWGGSHVWKVGGRVFAIGSMPEGRADLVHVSFKVSDLSFEMLKAAPGCRPAPYLASRGMRWIQRIGDESMDDAGLRDYLVESHRLVVARLTRAARIELGL